MRRKCRGLQSQLHELIDERAEMTAKVRDRKGHLAVGGKAISEMGREMSSVCVCEKRKRMEVKVKKTEELKSAKNGVMQRERRERGRE